MEKYLTPDDIANNIRMTRETFNGAFLIVEGPTDERFYGRFIGQDYCRTEHANGRENAIKIAKILENGGFEGYLVVVDADFCYIEEDTPTDKNILVTDTHDLESMIFFSTALDMLLSEFGYGWKIAKLISPIQELVAKVAWPVGALRLLNTPKRDNLQLKFQGLDYSKFVNLDHWTCDVDELIKEVLSNSISARSGFNDVKNKLLKMLGQEHNPKYICKSDDLIGIFTLGLTQKFGNPSAKQMNMVIVTNALRLIYNQDLFESSKLYSAIKEWERTSSPFKILKEV